MKNKVFSPTRNSQVVCFVYYKLYISLNMGLFVTVFFFFLTIASLPKLTLKHFNCRSNIAIFTQ